MQFDFLLMEVMLLDNVSWVDHDIQFGRICCFRVDLAIQFSARIPIFREDVDSLQFGTKADILPCLCR
jgi:hypothetical protein